MKSQLWRTVNGRSALEFVAGPIGSRRPAQSWWSTLVEFVRTAWRGE